MWQPELCVTSSTILQALVVETTTYDQLVFGQVGGELALELGKAVVLAVGDAEVVVDVEEGLAGPLAGEFVSIEMLELTLTQIRRHMKQLMLLQLLLLIHLPHPFPNHLQPPTIHLMFLLRRMPTTTSKRVMFHLHPLLSLDKRLLHFLSTEYISVEMLTEYLGCLVLDSILGVDGDDVTDAHLEEGLTHALGVAAVDEYHLR